MAHARQEPRDQEAAHDEPAIIERAQRAQLDLRETFQMRTHRDKRVGEAVAEKQKGRRKENRAN